MCVCVCDEGECGEKREKKYTTKQNKTKQTDKQTNRQTHTHTHTHTQRTRTLTRKEKKVGRHIISRSSTAKMSQIVCCRCCCCFRERMYAASGGGMVLARCAVQYRITCPPFVAVPYDALPAVVHRAVDRRDDLPVVVHAVMAHPD